ncbi:DUF456 domain-containing protein [Chitinilyticum piscinae]|uniref:DUF456 domain-containing protein n=1 Tax=Chitinilyticum piscinae TaxID=2866724 RepID=A0A8J7FJ27_9NEIS|nr:DUF456 domain-containing protein [Chitinilyticum piscinae]MBE9609015.1 DUF456 domain-containing protein [Chitinilyticum piscinae]
MFDFLADPASLWFVFAFLLMGVGLAGSVLPVLPGSPLIFAGVLIAAWQNHFERLGWPTFILLGLLVLVSQIIDYIAGAAGAKAVGASRQAVWGALAGSIIGLFFGLPGLILGPFVGAVLGELLAQSSLGQAGKVGIASWLGFIVGSILKLVLAAAMLVVAALGWWVF